MINMENLILKKWRFCCLKIEEINNQLDECGKLNYFKKYYLQKEKNRYIRKQKIYSQLLSEAKFW